MLFLYDAVCPFQWFMEKACAASVCGIVYWKIQVDFTFTSLLSRKGHGTLISSPHPFLLFCATLTLSLQGADFNSNITPFSMQTIFHPGFLSL
jgi:hypothetical protein